MLNALSPTSHSQHCVKLDNWVWDHVTKKEVRIYGWTAESQSIASTAFGLESVPNVSSKPMESFSTHNRWTMPNEQYLRRMEQRFQRTLCSTTAPTFLFRNQSYPKGLCRRKTRLAKQPIQYPADRGRISRSTTGKWKPVAQHTSTTSIKAEWTSTSLSVTHNIRFK